MTRKCDRGGCGRLWAVGVISESEGHGNAGIGTEDEPIGISYAFYILITHSLWYGDLARILPLVGEINGSTCGHGNPRPTSRALGPTKDNTHENEDYEEDEGGWPRIE